MPEVKEQIPPNLPAKNESRNRPGNPENKTTPKQALEELRENRSNSYN